MSDYPDHPAALKGTFTYGTKRGALKTVRLDELLAYQGAGLRAPVLYVGLWNLVDDQKKWAQKNGFYAV